MEFSGAEEEGDGGVQVMGAGGGSHRGEGQRPTLNS